MKSTNGPPELYYTHTHFPVCEAFQTSSAKAETGQNSLYLNFRSALEVKSTTVVCSLGGVMCVCIPIDAAAQYFEKAAVCDLQDFIPLALTFKARLSSRLYSFFLRE